MTKQRRLTREFEDEAVRLMATSGRTQRAGVGVTGGRRCQAKRRRRISLPG